MYLDVSVFRRTHLDILNKCVEFYRHTMTYFELLLVLTGAVQVALADYYLHYDNNNNPCIGPCNIKSDYYFCYTRSSWGYCSPV